MKKITIFFLFFLALIACNNNKKPKVVNKITPNKKKVKTDSLNELFLSKAIYDTALFYNNAPRHKEVFLLNEKKLFFFYSELNNFFSKKEKQMPISIKQITWSLDSVNLITVWYKKKDGVYTPFHHSINNKNTVF